MSDNGPTPSPADTANMSQAEIAAMFNNDFVDVKSIVRERVEFLPRISLAGPKTEYKARKGVVDGDWYITPAEKPEDGSDVKYEILGPSFECTILHATQQLTQIDDATKKTLMESSEFQSMTDPIFLMDGRSGAPHIVAVAPYSSKAASATIRDFRLSHGMPTKKSQDGLSDVSAVGFKYNVYVMLKDGRVCLLANTVRGHFGTDPVTAETRDFKNVSDDSFVRARAICHELTPGLTLAHHVRVSSVPAGEKTSEPRPSFKVLGLQDPNLKGLIREKTDWLKDYLFRKWADKIGYAWNNTAPAQRERMVTAYAEIRPLLDRMGGHETAAKMALVRESAPALLEGPEPDFHAMDAARKPGEKAAIDALAGEVEDEAAAPKGVIDVPVSDPHAFKGGKDVKVEDLPF